jgi:hypothetical protein
MRHCRRRIARKAGPSRRSDLALPGGYPDVLLPYVSGSLRLRSGAWAAGANKKRPVETCCLSFLCRLDRSVVALAWGAFCSYHLPLSKSILPCQ